MWRAIERWGGLASVPVAELPLTVEETKRTVDVKSISDVRFKNGELFGIVQIERWLGDHIKSWSKGGKTKPDNLQMFCADCNVRHAVRASILNAIGHCRKGEVLLPKIALHPIG